MITRKIGSLWSNHDGSAFIEATIMVPVLFFLVAGVFEYSWLLYKQHLITAGVRDAARYLSRVDGDLNDPTLSGDFSAATKQNAQNLATTGSIAGGSYRRVTGWEPSDVVITVLDPPIDNAIDPVDGLRPYRAYFGSDNIYVVQVTANFTYSPIGLPLGWTGWLLNIPISVSHFERVIGKG